MSDDLDIRSGGVVAVDTASLRAAAEGFDLVARDVEEVIRLAGAGAAGLLTLSGIADAARARAETVCIGAGRALARAQETAEGLRTAAAVYELAELGAEWASARAAGDSAAMRRIEQRRVALTAEFPDTTVDAMGQSLERRLRWAAGLLQDAWTLAALGPVGALVTGTGGIAAAGAVLGGALPGIGSIPRSARLGGAPAPLEVHAVATPAVVAAPTSIAGLAKRLPSGAERVRVETYTMPGGQRQHVVYVSGTDLGRTTPWDNVANGQLAAGRRSASFDATLEALRHAGAEPGDVVHAVGHSQGAMIAAHLALEGGYDTRTLVSFGSPVDADLPEATLGVTVRHTDDPVAWLAAGGHEQVVGSDDSLVVERDGSWLPGPTLGSHHMTAYVETARLLDGSPDPRVDALRGVLDELAGAASVTAVEFSAERVAHGRWERVSPSTAGAG